MGGMYDPSTGTASSPEVTGGRTVAIFLCDASSNAPLDLRRLDLRMEPGDVLVIAVATVSSSSTAVVSANWQEV